MTCEGCRAFPAEWLCFVLTDRQVPPTRQHLCTACRDAAREVAHAVSWRRLAK